MKNSTVLNCQVLHNREKKVAQVSGELDLLESSEIILSKEEKDYQRFVTEKLKASADWDTRDSSMFSIR